MSHITRRVFSGLAIAAVPMIGTAASASSAIDTKTVLTVSGKIAAPGKVRFTIPELEKLGLDGFDTSTPWYREPVRFDGVRMTKLMQVVGARGETVTAIALNDYATDLPISDFETYGVILATRRNGDYMPVRDKGPLFIVYPYDSDPELKVQRYYSRSVWQVATLIVN